MLSSETERHLPQVVRVYQNHSLNSRAWDGFKPRTEDVIITTALKAGTTWMQTIVGNLIFQDQEMPAPLWQLTPWLDSRFGSIEEKLNLLAGQAHRRFLKTHLPVDALPYFPEVKYIYVGRDGRDVFMSLWNHYRHLHPDILEKYNDFPARANDPFPPCPDDVHEFFRMWISKSWFSWENDGFPFWSVFYHLQSWWTYRHVPNILFVHFNNLLNNLDGQMRIIANYLNIDVNEAIWSYLVEKATFKNMKANAKEVVPGEGGFLIGGAQRFINKGTNGRWKGVLTKDELDMYEEKAADQLSPDSKQWLEFGESVLNTNTS